MNAEEIVFEALRERPESGGRLLERFQAAGENPFAGRGALVYGALANLAAAGRIVVLAEGSGEVVAGLPGARVAAPSRAPGFPPSFALGTSQLGVIERVLSRVTKGLPPHFFEEMRRVVVADADRRAFHGTPVDRAVTEALSDLGPPDGVRHLLRRAAAGGPVRLTLARTRWRLLLIPLLLIGLLTLVRFFLLGVYTMPRASISMAPALIPAAEGGDGLVLTDLLTPRLRAPERGEIISFRLHGVPEPLVKRVMGLPGERIEVREGELIVNGNRLLKERSLLDRVAVPLGAGESCLEATDDPLVRRIAEKVLHSGYLLPDGSVNHVSGDLRDVVLSLQASARQPGDSLTITLDQGGKTPVILLMDTTGHQAGLSVDGIERVKGAELKLPLGEPRSLWLTNADRCLRLEIDGKEVVRVDLRGEGGRPKISIRLDGKSMKIDAFAVARDLFHEPLPGPRQEWKLGPNDYFLLGDNSPQSRDSRHFGPISGDALEGRVFAVVWPLGRARWVR